MIAHLQTNGLPYAPGPCSSPGEQCLHGNAFIAAESESHRGGEAQRGLDPWLISCQTSQAAQRRLISPSQRSIPTHAPAASPRSALLPTFAAPCCLPSQHPAACLEHTASG